MFRRRPRGKWREIREDYRSLPRDRWTEDEEEHWWQTCTDDEYWQYWEDWSRDTFEHPTVRSIRRGCLAAILEGGKASHPLEFAAMLRVEGDTVTELVLLPGTVQGDEHAILETWMQPVDKSVRGTVHTHPDPHPYPSDADFEFFNANGTIHIIAAEPFDEDAWRAYDHEGVPVYIEVVDDPDDAGDPVHTWEEWEADNADADAADREPGAS